MSLYHKYRPQSLEEIKGNEEIVEALGSMLSNPKKMPHVYLFHGASGCGKTTLARIIQKQLKVSDSDYIENNSASQRGIDDMRALIKNCQFKPLNSPYRIYLLDECHKLPSTSQNALLKILEDTPKHVIFILATTDPGNLIAAVKNRCQKFQVKPLSDRQMKRLLKSVVSNEKDELDKEVYTQIIQTAEGVSREALMILDQVLNTEESKRLEAAKQPAILKSVTFDLCKAMIYKSDWGKVAEILKGLKGQDPESIRRAVLGYAQVILLKEDNSKAALVLEEFLEPTYDSGFPQLTYACYSVIKNS